MSESNESEKTQECPFCAERINIRAKKCRYCSETIDATLRVAEEARRASQSSGGGAAVATVTVQDSPPGNNKGVGFWLGLGILLFPFIFAWFTLGKGYSIAARVIAFGWMFFVILGLLLLLKSGIRYQLHTNKEAFS